MSKTVKFHLTGLSALLMHADDVESADEVRAYRLDPDNSSKQDGPAGDDRFPAWTWQTYLYHDGLHVAWPSANLMACLLKAGAQVRTGKGTKTFKEATQSALVPASEHFEFRYLGSKIDATPIRKFMDEPFPVQKRLVQDIGFKLDIRRAKVGQAKHVRVRPRFEVESESEENTWNISGELLVIDPEILPHLETIFRLAGNVGLGDWRPGSPKSPGPFGRFEAAVKIGK